MVVCLLILSAALIHPPANHDGLTYRMPRLYHWLQNHGWFWIGALDYRMDIAGTGFEWLSAPLVIASRTDRLLFLLNYLPFLLLPGLSFLAGTGLGLRPRSSQWWMYVWPLAYGVAMQAGSIGNDLPGVVLSVASLAFAREAERSKPFICLTFSAAAAVVMTSVKITTLPLALPLAIYWCAQAWKLLPLSKILRIPLVLAPVIALCGILPISFLCWKHTGKWNGNPDNRLGSATTNPLAGVIGNGLNLTAASLYPPVLPGAGAIGEKITGWLESRSWHGWVRDGAGSHKINLNQELPSEELAGIGLAVSFLITLWIIRSFRSSSGNVSQRALLSKLYSIASLVAFVVFLAKVNSSTTARLALPFTPHLVFSAILLTSQGRTVPHRFWAVLPALFLLPTLVLNPNRPLVSAQWLRSLPLLSASISSRLDQVYAVYAHRNMLLAPFARRIPDGATVGFAGGTDHPASALFLPLGRIRVIDLNENNLDHAQWIVGTEGGIQQRIGAPSEKLKGFVHVYEKSMIDKVVMGPETWHLYQRR